MLLKEAFRFVGRWMGSGIRRPGLEDGVDIIVGTTTPRLQSAGIGRRIPYSLKLIIFVFNFRNGKLIMLF